MMQGQNGHDKQILSLEILSCRRITVELVPGSILGAFLRISHLLTFPEKNVYRLRF